MTSQPAVRAEPAEVRAGSRNTSPPGRQVDGSGQSQSAVNTGRCRSAGQMERPGPRGGVYLQPTRPPQDRQADRRWTLTSRPLLESRTQTAHSRATLLIRRENVFRPDGLASRLSHHFRSKLDKAPNVCRPAVLWTLNHERQTLFDLPTEC